MDQYITGSAIREFRERKGITQAELADQLNVSDKAVSRWETGRGYPDITLLEPLAKALGVSVIELLNGSRITNRNGSANMARSLICVCPICGNIIHLTGAALVSCCGITLSPLEAEEENPEHMFRMEKVEDEWFVTLQHSMSKEHYISFLAWACGDRFDLVKLYPEGEAQARFKCRGHGYLYAYCNRHGLFRKRL